MICGSPLQNIRAEGLSGAHNLVLSKIGLPLPPCLVASGVGFGLSESPIP